MWLPWYLTSSLFFSLTGVFRRQDRDRAEPANSNREAPCYPVVVARTTTLRTRAKQQKRAGDREKSTHNKTPKIPKRKTPDGQGGCLAASPPTPTPTPTKLFAKNKQTNAAHHPSKKTITKRRGGVTRRKFALSPPPLTLLCFLSLAHPIAFLALYYASSSLQRKFLVPRSVRPTPLQSAFPTQQQQESRCPLPLKRRRRTFLPPRGVGLN